MDIFDMKQATIKQIRAHYHAWGYQARIDREGHVRIRNTAPHRRAIRDWLEGGYVEQYYIDDRNNVHKI